MPKQSRKKAQSKAGPHEPDAMQLLKADHKHVKKLFEHFHAASGSERASIASRLFFELAVHTKLEEELFYPALQRTLRPAEAFDTSARANGLDLSDEDLDDPHHEVNGMDLDADENDDGTDAELIDAAFEEHQGATELVEQLKSLDPSGTDYELVFEEFEDAVIEHISGEEDVIFPMAAAELDLQSLGVAMQRRRDELLSSLAA